MMISYLDLQFDVNGDICLNFNNFNIYMYLIFDLHLKITVKQNYELIYPLIAVVYNLSYM